MTTESWSLKGDYFENCNCEILCPCVVQGSAAVPTEGHCDVGFAFHIDEGEFNGVSLNGLNFVVAVFTPGKMSDGNWTMAAYIDQRAEPRQRSALERVLSGEVGGPMGSHWRPLISSFLGTRYVPITYRKDGRTRSVHIPQVMDFTVEGIMARGRDQPMRLDNTAHPVSSSLALARGVQSTYSDHGMTWDNSRKNGHYAQFDWRWP